jgi:hypothetical protein
MKRRQELQAQGVVVVPMQPMQPMQPVYYQQPVQAVGQAPAGYNYAAAPAPVQTYVAPQAQAYSAPQQSYAAPPAQSYAAPPTTTYEVPPTTTGDSSLSVSVPGTDAKVDVKV